MNINQTEFENLLAKKILTIATAEDPAHDFLHFKRVVNLAKILCTEEQAKMEVVVPAAWLHDMVIIPKNDPRRKQASKLSAESAIEYLQQIQYPEIYFQDIYHAIEAHSFSANIEARTLEAKIVQDADRLDGLGAVGIARCFATAGSLKRPFYSDTDPFCDQLYNQRSPDDNQFTLDHFFVKLFKTAKTLQTQSGRQEGERRVAIMKKYLADLRIEILFNAD